MDGFIFLVFLLLLIISTMGTLLSGPVDTTAIVGDTVQLHCRSNLTTTVLWEYGQRGHHKTIFGPTSDGRGAIYPSFVAKFSCLRQEDGFQNLVIKNVTFSDAGTYTCVDDEGHAYHPGRSSLGRWASASLNIIERMSSTKSTLYYTDTITDSNLIDVNHPNDETFIMRGLVPFLIAMMLVIFLWKRRSGRCCRNIERIIKRLFKSDRTKKKALSEDIHLLNAVATDKHKDGLNARSFLVKSKVLAVIPGNGYITGISVLGLELFVIRGTWSPGNIFSCRKAKIYNTFNFTFTREMEISGALGLCAIVASPQYNCLYISDVRLKVVYRYNPSDSDVVKWLVGGECWGLSVTNNFSVLVTLPAIKQIKEYTPNGILIRQMNLESSIEDPQHCVQLSSDRLVVSHGWRKSVHRVCIVDTNGSIINSYGGFPGSGIRDLFSPRNMAVDKNGNVLIADQFNNRVVLLSPSLTPLGYIAVPGHEMRYPYALHLDQQNHRLYIGEEMGTGCVFIMECVDNAV